MSPRICLGRDQARFQIYTALIKFVSDNSNYWDTLGFSSVAVTTTLCMSLRGVFVSGKYHTMKLSSEVKQAQINIVSPTSDVFYESAHLKKLI